MMKKQILLLSVAFMAIGAKAKDPNALPTAQPMTASDKQTGAKGHAEIVPEFGGAYDGPQAAYVRTVGQKIAVQSGLSNSQGDFTITLLNSPVDNAFAIPGGYVYLTRQIMALMNNEAEMASVLGHEVGHVAARHGAQRQSRATKGQLGALVLTGLGALLGGSQGAQLGQQLGSNLAVRYIQKFSRAQEYQADDLGVSYLAKGGYDPIASSTMLAALAAETALDARVNATPQGNVPKWASSHPDPASRVVRAADRAKASGATGKALNRDAFLAALDGILYDDDPKQGVVDGQTFRHPDLKMTFTAPTGFAVSNGTQAVTVSGSSGRASFAGGPYNGDLNAYIAGVFKAVGDQNKIAINYGSIEKVQINGLGAARASAEVAGQSGTTTVTVYAYEFAKDQAFHIMAIHGSTTPGLFNSLFQSVRRLSATEVASIKPRRIDVVTVRSGDTIEKLAARMAYTTHQVDRFTVLNALKPGEALQPGRKVKIVIYG